MKRAALVLIAVLLVVSASGCRTLCEMFCGGKEAQTNVDITVEVEKFSDGEPVEPGDAGEAIPWGEDVSREHMPAVFNGRGQDRLLAEEAARQDAIRKLLERISGLAIDARTDVHDLTAASRGVATRVEGVLKGMREVGMRYYENGLVEVAMRISMFEVVEALKSAYRSVRLDERLVSEQAIEDVHRQSRVKELTAVGRSALKDSEGVRKVRAMRAAEADCHARIAARVSGLTLKGATTVGNLALASDVIGSKVSMLVLSGVRFADYRFAESRLRCGAVEGSRGARNGA